MKSSPSIWHLLHSVKSKVKISSIFVVFLENLNFTLHKTLRKWNDTMTTIIFKHFALCIVTRLFFFFPDILELEDDKVNSYF